MATIAILCLGLTTERTIIGIVKEADGKAAANIPVKLMAKGKSGGPTKIPPGGNPTGDAIIGQSPRMLGSGDSPVQETKTDTAGKFTFNNVSPNVYEIVAGSGSKTAITTINIKENVEIPQVTLTLPR